MSLVNKKKDALAYVLIAYFSCCAQILQEMASTGEKRGWLKIMYQVCVCHYEDASNSLDPRTHEDRSSEQSSRRSNSIAVRALTASLNPRLSQPNGHL